MDYPAPDGARQPANAFHGAARAINGISQRMLTVTLRNLEHDGILIRTVHPTIPPRVEYELSDRGRSLKVALAPIRKWVRENQADIEEARERVRE
jgi:DNA-binding HxlR family transcriptional regulator